MTKKPLSVVRVVAFCLPLALVTSCGTGSEAVQNTIVNFNPVAIGQLTIVGAGGSNGQIYRIEVRSPTGYPQIGVKLVIDSQYIVYAGRPGVVCTTLPCTAPGATPLTLPYETTTDSNGTYEVTVIYSWLAATKGDFTAVEAFSGTGYGNSNIAFTCSDPFPAVDPPCPS